MTDLLNIRLPFQEQIAFFRQKLNLPSERWDSIKKAAHDRGFIVAGAMKADLVANLRQAVDAAIAGGDTLDDFRKKFRAIVQKHGWHGWTGEGTKAGEAWRTKIIYSTNLASSHAAGRWQQLNHPDLLRERPFWRYIHNDSVMHPRPHHLAWHGLTLRHDHPFWQTHFAPNGWGCRCRVKAVRAPVAGDATEPPQGWDQRDTKGLMPGIDRGWDYAPGANAATPLRQMVQDKLIQYPDAIAKALSRDVSRWVVAHADTAVFVREAINAPDLVQDLWLGFVQNPQIDTLAGHEVQDYLVLMPAQSARHVNLHHQWDGKDQRAPIPDDFNGAQAWINSPDTLELGTPGPTGLQRLRATKRVGGENFVSIWEIRPGKRNRSIALISLWVSR